MVSKVLTFSLFVLHKVLFFVFRDNVLYFWLTFFFVPRIMSRDDIAEADSPPRLEDKSNEKHALGQDANVSTSTISTAEERKFARIRDNEYAKSIWRFITWTPKRCRWDPESPPRFSMGLNILFAFVSLDHCLSLCPFEPKSCSTFQQTKKPTQNGLSS